MYNVLKISEAYILLNIFHILFRKNSLKGKMGLIRQRAREC